MHDRSKIFAFLDDCNRRRLPSVLVTLTDVSGSGARAPGTLMAVAADGSHAGSFSGGCVEAAVIGEAIEALATGMARCVRFGEGSRYIDIRLPCGGGIDLLFTPNPNPVAIEKASALLSARRPILLRLSLDGTVETAPAGPAATTGWNGTSFQLRHNPALRIVVLGHGAEPMALLDIAIAFGAECRLLSPQADQVEAARTQGIDADVLHIVGKVDSLRADAWTAIVALFHDHDWETALLMEALRQEPFFIGAMGSRKTHAERCRRLLDAGVLPHDLSRILGPVGLIPATRDPMTLAVSVMAQIVEAYRSADERNRLAVSTAHDCIEPR